MTSLFFSCAKGKGKLYSTLLRAWLRSYAEYSSRAFVSNYAVSLVRSYAEYSSNAFARRKNGRGR
jgi:hypothetical protein